MSTHDQAADSTERPEEGFRGLAAHRDQPDVLSHAVDLAVDYRGDVSLTLDDGRTVEGFVFDRRRHTTEGEQIRLIETGSTSRTAVPLARIERLEFTGRDTAAGKSFETWMRKYVEKKLAGESASIESEAI